MAQIPITMSALATADSSSPLSKRRKFVPPQPTIIPSQTNVDLAHHAFSSPILPQLSSRAPSPAEIEADLLQVGMRVRKSVADGYQTSFQKRFTPQPFANRLSRLSPETQKALLAGNGSQVDAPEPFSAGGLHKVGALAMQPISTATFCGINLSALAYYSDDCTETLANQTLWSYTTSHKRGYENDSDSDDSGDWQPDTPTLQPDSGMMPVDYFNIGMDNMSDTGSMMQTGHGLNSQGRKVAKPRSRVRNTGMDMSSMPMPPSDFNPFANIQMEQPQPQPYGFVPETARCHRRMMSCGMEASLNDFGEAPFLQRPEDVEMDCS